MYVGRYERTGTRTFRYVLWNASEPDEPSAAAHQDAGADETSTVTALKQLRALARRRILDKKQWWSQ